MAGGVQLGQGGLRLHLQRALHTDMDEKKRKSNWRALHADIEETIRSGKALTPPSEDTVVIQGGTGQAAGCVLLCGGL